ncbi:4'-phosphopantetheinyl transferase [Streptomyces sp. NPDC001262]|uniref:4'-phosphopantetheinyl transferase family protein n=1 Tax=unclassified Streptomyces TaxID=2593676 RepID=UPI0036A6262B
MPPVREGPLPGTAIALFRGGPGTATCLHDREEELLRGLPVRRRADFAAGRMAAARALAALGTGGPVLRDGRRPVFPAGIRGSISHCTGHIGACIASAHPEVCATGIDLERTGRLGRDAARIVCTSRERAWVAEGRRPQDRLTVLFSAKEAVYKAVSGLCTRRPVFHDVELGVERGRLHIEVAAALLTAPHRLTGRVRRLPGGHVLASVVVRSGAAPCACPGTQPST